MGVQMKTAIDADFFRNITTYERSINLFLRVMDGLNMKPVMHEFVADTELKGNEYLQQLSDTKKIEIIHYKDYIEDTDQDDYEKYFIAAFERINKYDFPNNQDIYRYAEPDESLGEIRSLYMARKMGYRYFMSDDADAKLIAKNFFLTKSRVDVQSLFEVLTICKEKNIGLQWKDINPTVCNAMLKRQDKVNKLKELYNG